MKIGGLLQQTEKQFIEADLYYGHGTDNAWDDAVALVLYALGLPIDSDASVAEQEVSEAQCVRVSALVAQRVQARVPVPYLTHEAYFAGLSFYVNENVLIPRSPFGELIHRHFEPWVHADRIQTILEIGTGSGCMAIACAKALPHAKIDASDIDEKALAVAKRNVEVHSVAEQVTLIQSDLFSALQNKVYDLIISNPPYVDAQDMRALPQEYQHEPEHALAAGDDGLACVDIMLCEAKHYLKEGGVMIVEVGNSAVALEKKYPTLAFTWIDFENGGEGVFLLTKEQLEGVVCQ